MNKEQTSNTAKTQQLNIADVSGSYFNILFGNHLMAQMQIKDGKLIVLKAINGWGDAVDMSTVKIEVV